MLRKLILAAALIVLPSTVFAQATGPTIRDPAGGATRDPALGVGTVEVPLKRDPAGGTMIDDAPRFRTYVMQERVPSYSYADPVAVGTVLPEEGIVYREVPADYGLQGYRYTVINERPVVVERGTRRIVQIIN